MKDFEKQSAAGEGSVSLWDNDAEVSDGAEFSAEGAQAAASDGIKRGVTSYHDYWDFLRQMPDAPSVPKMSQLRLWWNKRPKVWQKKLILITALVLLTVFVSGCVFNWFGLPTRILHDTAAELGYKTLVHPLNKIDWQDLKADAENSGAVHPYVLVTAEQFDGARQLYYSGESGYVTDRMDYALSSADDMIELPLLTGGQNGETSGLSGEAVNRVMTLAGAWQITGEEKYARRCLTELENICALQSRQSDGFLAYEMSMAVALGYDWLYDYLTKEQRNAVAQVVYEYGIKPVSLLDTAQNRWCVSKNCGVQYYGGAGVAAMAVSEHYPEEAAKFLSEAYYDIPLHFVSFAPDGFYAEGNGLWKETSSYLLYFITTSRNFMGGDYGLSDLSGFDKLGYFPIYISAPQGVFNFGDNSNLPLFSPVLHWFAKEYSEPCLAYFQTLSDKTAEDPGESFLSCLWADDEAMAEGENFDLPLSVYLSGDNSAEYVSMRSAYCSPDATYFGIKSGNGGLSQSDLDIGSFVYDAQGERWFLDPGEAQNPLSGYSDALVGGGRWRTYVKRAEGHNTLVINPGRASEDQYPFASVKFSSFEQTEGGGKAVMDMTDAYIRNGVKSVIRSVEMYDNYSKILINDKIICKTKSDIWWFAHTAAKIEISGNGKAALLTVFDERGDPKRIKLRIISAQGTFTQADAVPLSDKPRFRDNNSAGGVKKLVICLENVKTAEISVIIEPHGL